MISRLRIFSTLFNEEKKPTFLNWNMSPPFSGSFLFKLFYLFLFIAPGYVGEGGVWVFFSHICTLSIALTFRAAEASV